MRVSGSDREGRGLIGELMAAWVVILVVLALGLTVTSFHGLGLRDRTLPRWYDPPVASVQSPEDEAMDRSGTATVSRSTTDDICNMIAPSASYARASVSGAPAHQSGLPC